MSRLRIFRDSKNWTQAELARRSGVSRSSIAAIENGALVPSVHAALSLARCLDCTVEELFSDIKESAIEWAWNSAHGSPTYWEAAFDQKVLAFPVEPSAFSILPPDGRFDGQSRRLFSAGNPYMSLVMASCDPASGFLSSLMGAKTGIRVLPFHRASRKRYLCLNREWCMWPEPT